MKNRIIVFGASNSRKSINQTLALHAAESVVNGTVRLLDLNDFEMPIYGIDKEQESGIPLLAQEFKKELQKSDAIIISFAEHNGSYSAAFKNIMDWVSRIDGTLWSNKPMLLLATSPGGRGAQSVLSTAANSFPHQGGKVVSAISIPSFHKNFNAQTGITDSELEFKLSEGIQALEHVLEENKILE